MLRVIPEAVVSGHSVEGALRRLRSLAENTLVRVRDLRFRICGVEPDLLSAWKSILSPGCGKCDRPNPCLSGRFHLRALWQHFSDPACFRDTRGLEKVWILSEKVWGR